MNDTNDFVGNEASIQPLIKNTDTSSFPKDVLEASKDIPILVDFWAEWCGPCKQLGPTLESVVKSYEGKIKLVKIDIDKNEIEKIIQLSLFLGRGIGARGTPSIFVNENFSPGYISKQSIIDMLK